MTFKKLFFLISIVLFLVFIYFSFLVAKETFTQFDFNTTVKFQDHISRRWDLPFSVLSLIGTAEITGFIWFLIFLYLVVRRFWLSALSLLLLPIGLFIEVFGKLFVYHPAPPHLFYRGVIHFDLPSQAVQTYYSYPSGHVTRTSFLIVFLMCYIFFRKSSFFKIFIQPGLVIFLILMLISRIYLGEHWFTDVIGGLLIGSSLGLLAGITIPIKKSKI